MAEVKESDPYMSTVIWQQCLACLQDELSSQQYNTWIRPLQFIDKQSIIQLVAPNRFVQNNEVDNSRNSTCLETSFLKKLSSESFFKKVQ